MARKPARKKKIVTDKMTETLSPVTDVDNADYDSLKKCVDAWYRSRTAHHVDYLVEVIESNYQLSNWEEKQLDDLFEKFAAKYKSPLAEALK